MLLLSEKMVSLIFRGRIDDQIKLQGYRIELGEIETRLNQLEGVSSAAVTVREDANQQGNWLVMLS